MENKLYYVDAYQKSFSAKVLKQDQDSDGNWYVVLDQTAFYPTGGGQPHDTGTINDVQVVRVEETAGEIRHYLEHPLEKSEAEISGVIDWARRFDHMQQHAGQHILSAAFDQLCHFKTVGFHLGNASLTIDIETENLTEEQAIQAERLANQIILENRKIETRWVTEAELSQYPLRKETKVKEDIRLVIVPDFDYNGCGGTHPKVTGEVRAVKILDWEKQKKNVRVQFVCGERVLQQFQQKNKVLQDLTKLLSAPEKEMATAVTKLFQNEKELEKALEHANERLLQYEVNELLYDSKMVNDVSIISRIFQGRTIQELQKLARMIVSEEPQVNVILVTLNENKLQLVGARGENASVNMKNLIGHALSLINGKGGGNDSFAQGGGAALMPAEQFLDRILTNVNGI